MHKEKILIKTKIKEADGTLKEIKQEVEVDLLREGNRYFTKEGGELVTLKKDGKQYPALVNINIEKSMTSVTYLHPMKGGSNRIQPQPGSNWEIEQQRFEFPQSAQGFATSVMIGVLVMVVLAIGIVIWRRQRSNK